MRRRAMVLTVALLGAAAACMRVEAQAVPGTLHACVSITSDKERLRCFDHEMAKLEAADTTASPGASLPPEQTFGLTGEQILKLQSRQAGTPRPPKLSKLTAQIASTTHNSEGRWIFKLDNGQVWRQTETRNFAAVPAGTAVKIRTGAMGTYWLETNSHNWTRVERVL